MRYWAYLAGKFVAAGAPLFGLLILVGKAFPPQPHREGWPQLHTMTQDLLCGLALLGWFVLCTSALYFIVRDQRSRCRVCARRLRMPVETGSWSHMLQLGRPRIESICPYGHGTLTEDELQISGGANPQWKAHSDDIWDELCAPGKDTGQEP
jgi:hypothetical protein